MKKEQQGSISSHINQHGKTVLERKKEWMKVRVGFENSCNGNKYRKE